MEATSFNVPEEVQGPLRRASQLFGDLMGYVDNLAGLKGEDLRSVIILRSAEVYGVVQLAGILFGYKCQESMPKVIKTYSLLLEKVLDWLYSGADYQAGLELEGLIFKYEVGLYILVAGCAGVGAVVPYYEEGGGNDN
jgi:hypothetical protein